MNAPAMRRSSRYTRGVRASRACPSPSAQARRSFVVSEVCDSTALVDHDSAKNKFAAVVVLTGVSRVYVQGIDIPTSSRKRRRVYDTEQKALVGRTTGFGLGA